MGQHSHRPGDNTSAVIFKDHHWWRTNYFGDGIMISPRVYHLGGGTYHSRRDKGEKPVTELAVAGFIALGMATALRVALYMRSRE